MARDRMSGYVKHKDVYEAKRLRQKAIKAYEVAAPSRIEQGGTP